MSTQKSTTCYHSESSLLSNVPNSYKLERNRSIHAFHADPEGFALARPKPAASRWASGILDRQYSISATRAAFSAARADCLASQWRIFASLAIGPQQVAPSAVPLAEMPAGSDAPPRARPG